jgi:hypothetical protein
VMYMCGARPIQGPGCDRAATVGGSYIMRLASSETHDLRLGAVCSSTCGTRIGVPGVVHTYAGVNGRVHRSVDAETLADPYKGKTPLPRVPNYQEPFASRHPNTWNARANKYLEQSPETHHHRIHSFPPIATE